VPHAQLRFFIPAFYANLNTSDISDLRRQLDTNFSVVQIRISKTILALNGVSDLEEHLVSRARGEVWSSAWTWIQFLEECEKHRPGGTGASRSELHLTYLSIITSLSQDAEVLSTIKSTPGVRVFFTKGWVAAVDDAHTSKDLFRRLCDFLIRDINAKDPRNFQELIEGSGGTVNDLALLIVKHIRRVVPEKNHALADEDGFDLLAVFILLEAGGCLFDGPLHDALVANGLVKCVTTALCAVCGSAILITEQLIPLCLAVLVSHISTFPGFPWLKEALDGGLLRAILLCASRRMPITFVPLNYLISEVVPASLVYHSVLSRLRTALDDAKDLADTPEFRASPYVREWTNFAELATERLAIMERYDCGELGRQRACDHVEACAVSSGPILRSLCAFCI
jgi:hypothetical protein